MYQRLLTLTTIFNCFKSFILFLNCFILKGKLLKTLSPKQLKDFHNNEQTIAYSVKYGESKTLNGTHITHNIKSQIHHTSFDFKCNKWYTQFSSWYNIIPKYLILQFQQSLYTLIIY